MKDYLIVQLGFGRLGTQGRNRLFAISRLPEAFSRHPNKAAADADKINLRMCGRFNLRTNPKQVQEVFWLFDAPELPPRFNISP